MPPPFTTATEPASTLGKLRVLGRMAVVTEVLILVAVGLSLLVDRLNDNPNPNTLGRTLAGFAIWLFVLGGYEFWSYAERTKPKRSLLRAALLAVCVPLARAAGGMAIVLAIVVPYVAVGTYGLVVTAALVAALGWLRPGEMAACLLAGDDFADGEPLPNCQRTVAELGLPEAAVLAMQARPDQPKVCCLDSGGRKTVLVDSGLMATLNPGELRALLAHEVGHLQLNHRRGAAWADALTTACGALLAGAVLTACGILGQIPRSEAWPAAAFQWLPLLLLWVLLGQLAMTPVSLAISRAQERQANRRALEVTGDPRAFVSAAVKLAQYTAATGAPSWWEKWFTASHPSLDEVIEQARRFAAQRGIALEESQGSSNGYGVSS